MALTESDSEAAFPGAGDDGRAAARVGQPAGAMSHRGFHNAANAWPRRRLLSAAALSPVLFTVLLSAAGGSAPPVANPVSRPHLTAAKLAKKLDRTSDSHSHPHSVLGMVAAAHRPHCPGHHR